MVWTGLDALHEQIEEQRRFVEAPAPAYARLLELLAPLLIDDAARLERAWLTRTFRAKYERPLLIQASLRYLALKDGPSHPLFPGLVDPASPGSLTEPGIRIALGDDRLWPLLTERFVQTNETSRCLVWLWPAQLISETWPNASFGLFDIGASAGLNLVGDQLPRPWTTQQGDPLLPTSKALTVRTRQGFDPCPLDPLNADDARWLKACIWPGQFARQERLQLALLEYKRMSSTQSAPEVRNASATAIPQLLETHASHAIAYQSLVWDYLSGADQTLLVEQMGDWLRKGPAVHFWAQLELSGLQEPHRSCAIRIQAADGEEIRTFTLAYCHPHPSTIEVNAPDLARFSQFISSA